MRYEERENWWLTPNIILPLILLLIVFSAAIFATVRQASGPKKETMVVGVNTPFPPFENRVGEKVIGLDIDLAELIAKSLGRKLVIKDFNEFDALLPALQAGTLDMVISAATINPERGEIIDFSQSYFNASQAILTSKDRAFIYSGDPTDFRRIKVAYQKGTTSESWVEENLENKVTAKELVPFGDIAFGLQLLLMGSVDAVIIDEPVARAFAKNYPNLQIGGVIETGEQYGVAVQKNDPQNLLPRINKMLKTIGENGEYDKLVAKWFGGERK